MNGESKIKNLISGGDILAYKPVSEISRKINSIISEEPLDEVYESEPLIHYSKPLISISESLPSSVLSKMEDSITDIDSYISTLNRKIPNIKVGDISFNDYKIAYSKEDKDVIDEFMEYHFNNINGNTNIEIYNSLQNLRKEATEFKDIFSKLTYGDINITSEIASEMDNVRMDKLTELEREDNFQKINYAALNNDIQINRVSLAYANSLKSGAEKLFMLSLQDEYDEIGDKKGHIRSTITKSFNNASMKSKQDRVKNNLFVNTSVVKNSLVNIVNMRGQLLDSLHAKNKLQDMPNGYQCIETVNKAVDDMRNETLNKIVDFNKSVLLSSLNKDDNINSIKEKADLRNIFCSIK